MKMTGCLLSGCKNRYLVPFAVLGLALAAAAQEIIVKPLNQTAVYRVGEPAVWSVSVEKEGAPVNGKAKFSIKKGGLKLVQEGEVDLKNGAATVEAVRNDPGTLLLEVSLENSTNYGGAVFNREQILPSADEPADFDQFWQSKIAELQAVPMNVTLEKVEISGDVDYWKITMDNIRGSRICGQIAKPKNSAGPLPAMVQFQYAGVYPLKQEWVVNPAKEGWLAMNIIAHDLPIDREESFYQEHKNGALNTYPAIGCEDRETSYFLRMYLSCYRAVDYLTQRPDWNGKVLRVTGGSQGGLQSIMVAGLHPEVTAVTADVPAGCDLTGMLIGRAAGWPAWSWSGRAKAVEVSKYYDVVNFARRVKCPVLVSAGAIDRVCPPEGVIAMFNQLKGPKRLIVLPVGEHSRVGHEPFQAVLPSWSDALRTGRPLPME
jgi:cephalosporin-C deacetylase-like acetyl esterase